MKHVFMIDPKAFHNEQWRMDNVVDSLGQYFRTQEKLNFSILFSRNRRSAIGLIQEEAEKSGLGGMIRVYAIGGEGIQFDCLNTVALFPNMQLAIVPYGETSNFLNVFEKENAEKKTGNMLANFLDIPSLINSEALSTDIIRWGVNYALNSCYIGLASKAAKESRERKSGLSRKFLFNISKIVNFIKLIAFSFNKSKAAKKYELTIDNLDYSGNYSLIHVANGPYLNGKLTGIKNAAPNDGVLDIALIKASHPLRTISSIRRYLKGKRPKNCVIIQGKNITVRSTGGMWIQIDNEQILDTEINLNIVHHAIQLVAPEGLSYPTSELTAL